MTQVRCFPESTTLEAVQESLVDTLQCTHDKAEVLQPIFNSFVAFGSIVELDEHVVQKINTDPAMQQAGRT